MSKHKEAAIRRWTDNEAEKQKYREMRQDPEFKERLKQIREDKGCNKQSSDRLYRQWADDEWRQMITQKQSQGTKARWADPIKRQALLDAQQAGRDRKKPKADESIH